ncbi:MAG: 50S ribosomal protein L25, partial [Bacteroidia bacterium]
TNATLLRNKGEVPCVIYGGKEQIHFSADYRAFKPVIYTPETNLIAIELGGTTYKAVVQEAQFHKVTDKLIHVDFLEVVDGKPVTVHIPVKVVGGQAEGVKNGGRLVVQMRKLKVKGLIDKLPSAIELNAEKLDIGKSISAGDIKIDGITVLHPANISVISVLTTRAVEAEVAAPGVTTAAATPAAAAPATPAAPADKKK